MKKILGLDLGVGSIGWALIETTDNNQPVRILDIGVRIVPMNDDNDSNKFTKGQDITTNSTRTQKRTARKGYNRYQQRRAALMEELISKGMKPDEDLMKLAVMDLWQLRSDAVTKKLSLPEIGRVLYHINQKRGYKHAKEDSGDSKQREYVAIINKRYQELSEECLTIGQHFAKKLKENESIDENGKKFYSYRIKDQVFPRKAYEEEFDKIMLCQKSYYPNVFTEEFIDKIRNHIIFYQRKLRSCKHLVSVCEFEKRCFYDKSGNVIRDNKGNIVYDGPRVAPRTSPLFQLCKNWEAVNNIRFRNRRNEELFISVDQRKAMVDFLETNELLKLQDIYKILGITKKDGWWAGEAIGRGIKGNTTRIALAKALEQEPERERFLHFDLRLEATNKVDPETGEILQKISNKYQEEPLYRLWHTLYSIKDKEELASALKKNFGIVNETTIQNLYDIDFVTPGYGNKSSKAICRILPYLQIGLVYGDACEYAGFRHSQSLTTEENANRELVKKIPSLQKNELRQPVVEKILNQMINVYNALSDDSMYGAIDEIRIELARELKKSKEERRESSRINAAREKENQRIEKLIKGEKYNLPVTKTNILKYKLWEESNHLCFYCNQPIGVKNFLLGTEAQREHIIPKALLFNDSFSNQVCSCAKCNAEKGGATAFDFMRKRKDFQDYLERVEKFYLEKKITKAKHDNLLASYEDYLERKRQGKETEDDRNLWEDFISRQLRQSQYIARKAPEILRQGCRNVWATSGSVTDFLRRVWGYNSVLHDLNLEKARKAGETEMREIERGGEIHKEEHIVDWDKRLDHRHHAVDALTIACTSQSIIQRLNNLNASRELIKGEIEKPKEEWSEHNNLLQEWVHEKQPFTYEEVKKAVGGIFVSVKAGKKVTVPAKRKVFKNGKPITVQTNIIVPRGRLHEEQLYGGIMQYTKDGKGSISLNRKIVFRYKLGVGSMGYVFSGKESIEIVKDKKTGDMIMTDGFEQSLSYVVDSGVRNAIRERMNEGFPEGTTYITEAKKAVEDGRPYDASEVTKMVLDNLRTLEERPVYLDKNRKIAIKKARCFTGLTAVQPLRYKEGKPITFVLPKNNHHTAFYSDENGKIHELTVTFWHVVERRKYGIPLIIEKPSEVWRDITERREELPNEFLAQLPLPEWTFVQSLQQNEMFILGMSDDEIKDAIANNNRIVLCNHLYRVQKMSKGDYWFRLHTETKLDDSPSAKESLKFYRFKSISAFQNANPYKVKVSLLGKIIEK